MQKSCPDPTKPSELLAHYIVQFKKMIRIWYRVRLRDPFGSKRKKVYHDLIKMKNSCQGRICFVFANGPSVQKLDAKKVASFCRNNNADIFCVNYYINSEFARIVKPDYWVLSDPNTVDVAQDRNKMSFDNANTLIQKGVFVANNYTHKLVGDINVPVIAFNDIETSNIFSNSIDPTYPRSYLSMSAYKALAIAGYAGYDRIYICGFDNSYVKNLGCDRENRIYRVNEHFDNKAYPNPNPVQLLNYQYRTVSDELLAYSRLFSDLRKFQSLNVINLDTDSLTDAFRKDDSLDIYKEITPNHLAR